MKKLRKKITKIEDKKYGLLGHPLGHSLSPVIHRDIMEKMKIKGSYSLFEISPEEFDKKIKKLTGELSGFNITIPYKEKIMEYIPEKDENAVKIGAVNTVRGNKGFNTDIEGFLACGMDFKDKKVLVTGGGGVSRVMVAGALIKGAGSVHIRTRRPEQGLEIKREFSGIFPGAKIVAEDYGEGPGRFDFILNGTPVGMWPSCNGIPVDDETIKQAGYVFDSIYNPLSTRLLLKAGSFGVKTQNGLLMLVSQALKAQEIWNPDFDFKNYEPERIIPGLKKILIKDFPVKYVLTGFMGSGKSTAGKTLARRLGIGFADLDLMIVEECKMSIPSIFKNKGENFFRQKEKECLEKLMEGKESLVISTGGGALIDPVNTETVKKNNGFIIFLDIPLDDTLERLGDKNDRPLLVGKKREDIIRLYENRLPVYNRICDYKQNALLTPEQTVNQIKKVLGF